MKYIKFEFGNGLYDLINVEKVKRFIILGNRIDVIYSDGDGCGHDIDRYIYVKENEDSNSTRLNNFEEVKEKLLKLCDDWYGCQK